jgi:hypothetical protein
VGRWELDMGEEDLKDKNMNQEDKIDDEEDGIELEDLDQDNEKKKNEDDKTSIEDAASESQNPQTKAIAFIEDRYNKELEKIETQRMQIGVELNTLSECREKEIDEYTKRDLLKAEMRQDLAKREQNYNNLASKYSSIYTTKRNKILKKNILEKERDAWINRRNNITNDIDARVKQQYVLLNKKKEYIQSRSGAGNSVTQWYYDSKIESTEKDIDKNLKKHEELYPKLDEANSTVDNLQKQIDQLETEIKEMEIEEANALREAKMAKADYEANSGVLDTMDKEDEESRPEWYEEYKAKKAEYEQKTTLLERTASTKEILSDTVANNDDVDGDERPRVVMEEAYVEAALRRTPILKQINEAEIQNLLNYNPDTGKNYEEGEEKKNENILVRSIEDNILSDENIDMIKELATTLKGNTIVIKIDNILSAVFQEKPLDTILNSIMNADIKATRATIVEFVEKYSSNEFREQSPMAFGLANLIFPAIGDILNIGDKGDKMDAYNGTMAGQDADLGRDYKNFGISNGGATLGTILQTIKSLVNGRDIVQFVLSTALNKALKNNRFVKSGENAYEAIKSFGNIADDYNRAKSLDKYMQQVGRTDDKDNSQMMRMLSGARSAAVSNGIQNGINGVGNIGKTASSFLLGSTVGSLVNTGISGVTKLINVFVNSKVEGKHKDELLASPEVLGNVKYNKNLVSDEKFNQILKKVSGIASKDKLYGAIKTADAIALHVAMRKSYAEENTRTDFVLSGLGFKDRSVYPKISVYDIMKASGHTPSGGDWRRELSDALLVENKDYVTLGASIKGKLKTGLKYAGKGLMYAGAGIAAAATFPLSIPIYLMTGSSKTCKAAQNWVKTGIGKLFGRKQVPQMAMAAA